ncbi:MAG: protein-ADP-ribose hydrolase, partial [Holophaga sp.]|nr:protein-ADP-ribose hydrolase [Holophaga sp.]
MEPDPLDGLIEYLAPGTAPLPSRNLKWERFRSLVNRRAPGPASEDFLRHQDAFLQAEIEAKGITTLEDLVPAGGAIRLWQGDITTLRVDGIVNAANSGLLGCFFPNHNCIDNAIHTYAGIQLRNECAAIMELQGTPEPLGRARITRGYNLPARHVLHTVGPMISSSLTARDRDLLASCYRSCLHLAEEKGLQSLAFCCISTGEFRFPPEEAARIATGVVKAHLGEGGRLDSIVFNVFKPE